MPLAETMFLVFGRLDDSQKLLLICDLVRGFWLKENLVSISELSHSAIALFLWQVRDFSGIDMGWQIALNFINVCGIPL
jgi:hypothetical protein